MVYQDLYERSLTIRKALSAKDFAAESSFDDTSNGAEPVSLGLGKARDQVIAQSLVSLGNLEIEQVGTGGMGEGGRGPLEGP